MQKAESLRHNWRYAAVFLIVSLVVLADQLSKFWVRSNLALGESLPETGLFRLTHVRNTGASFGLFQDQSFFLTIVGFVGIFLVLLLIFGFSRRFPFTDSWLGRVAFGLILGGAIGNMTDRLRLGYITDFINISIWPAFNIADSAITVGTILLAYSLIVLAGKER